MLMDACAMLSQVGRSPRFLCLQSLLFVVALLATRPERLTAQAVNAAQTQAARVLLDSAIALHRFVNTMRRDYFAGADLSTAILVLEQLPGWLADYNAVAPHSALGYQSPQQYRSAKLVVGPMS